MKQNITNDQLNKLSEKGKERLRKWWFKEGIGKGKKDGTGYYVALPLLSIGQLIEFLDEHINTSTTKIIITTGLRKNEWFPRAEKWAVGYGGNDEMVKISRHNYFKNDLCDALWQAVKEILESEKDNLTNKI